MDFDLKWMVSEFIEQVWQRGSSSGKVRAPRVAEREDVPEKGPQRGHTPTAGDRSLRGHREVPERSPGETRREPVSVEALR